MKLAAMQAGGTPAAISQAQAALTEAKLKLAAMKAGGTPTAIAEAKVNLAEAQAKLAAMKAGGTPSGIQEATLALDTAVLKLADSAQPPVRLPLGSDTVAKIEEKNRFVEAELAQWRSVAVSTDHDDVGRKS